MVQTIIFFFSMETQQRNYIAPVAEQFMRLFPQQYVQDTIFGGGHNISQNVKFSDKSQQRKIASLVEMRKDRNARHLDQKASKESKVKATSDKIVHSHVKHAIFSLLIKLGSKVYLNISGKLEQL